MKYFNFIALILISCTIMFTSCEKNSVEPVNVQAVNDPGPITNPDQIFSVNLIAGQSIVVGTVTGSLTGSTLTVTYETDIQGNEAIDPGWKMNEIHFHVAYNYDDLPHNQKSGNPTVGKFLYKVENLPQISTHTFSIENVNGSIPLFFAAHAIVTNTNDGSTQTETAWGDGFEFTPDDEGVNGSWAMYFTYPEE